MRACTIFCRDCGKQFFFTRQFTEWSSARCFSHQLLSSPPLVQYSKSSFTFHFERRRYCFFFFCICPMTSNHHGPADWVMREDILVPRAVILLANATDRELWPGPIFWSLRIAAAKSENVWSELIIPIWFFCISSANQNKSFSRNLPELARACQSSRSVTLAKRIAAMGTRMERRKN